MIVDHSFLRSWANERVIILSLVALLFAYMQAGMPAGLTLIVAIVVAVQGVPPASRASARAEYASSNN